MVTLDPRWIARLEDCRAAVDRLRLVLTSDHEAAVADVAASIAALGLFSIDGSGLRYAQDREDGGGGEPELDGAVAPVDAAGVQRAANGLGVEPDCDGRAAGRTGGAHGVFDSGLGHEASLGDAVHARLVAGLETERALRVAAELRLAAALRELARLPTLTPTAPLPAPTSAAIRLGVDEFHPLPSHPLPADPA